MAPIPEEEIRQALLSSPESRMKAKQILTMFKSRLIHEDDKQEFAATVFKLTELVIIENVKYLSLKLEYK